MAGEREFGPDVTTDVVTWVRSRFFGKYRGRVIDNNDPTSRGRVKVKVPAVLDGQSVWAMPCLPYSGQGMGLYMVPEPDAAVWVEFEGGDPSFAIWSGMFWGDEELPEDEESRQATPPLKIIRSKKGLMVTLDDENETIKLSDEQGRNILNIQVQEGQINIQGVAKVVVEAPQIELVENATHPVVFGDDLLRYLMALEQVYLTHTHPGENVLGIPVTPATPVPPPPFATPALMSTKVKSG